ncbi:FO synthase [Ardenticatena maritima]|uniref:7,8-didemethyl-8-hydroxy-5-deazariboflavin synthase n=1 Tax=Ardenticatena maritima TaxID=872965 RepID=A0A0M8K6T5_9CHLR|nr:7,8-didemethyl-8-hydroxy-5-deazariboflavin synthase CofG [Ardenticatena maritima]GAP61961.1 FO synthase [Ardenticatena maritima]
MSITPFRLLGQLESGAPIDRETAYRLIRATGEEALALFQAAATLRTRMKGRRITYSRKVFIPLTNLCRDKCAYCTFARAPNDPRAHTMTLDEVLAVARQGAAHGCKEALFSLGDKPEERHARAREDLARLGYASTFEYLRAMAELVLEETGLLPHINAGILTREQMAALRPISASMGIMLESVSERLLERGQAHYGCPDKVPAVRLQMLREAGELRIPFTTGILIGIGETPEERVDALFAIADIHATYGHIQEVIIQNFRAKPDIRFANHPEPSAFDMMRTIAVARLILGGEMNIQAPPNLTPDAYGMYLLAGINDWGGVSPVTRDHINPEAPWPKLTELAQVTSAFGFSLHERLAIYPEFAARHEFVDPRMRAHIERYQHAMA